MLTQVRANEHGICFLFRKLAWSCECHGGYSFGSLILSVVRRTVSGYQMSELNPYTPPATPIKAPLVPTGVPGPHNYASLGERFAGVLIDGLVMLPVTIGFVVIAPKIFTVEEVSETDISAIFMGNTGYGIAAGLIMSVLGIAIYIAVQWTFWNATSQSIGKKVMKTQIVNLDGTPADVKTIAFKRYGLITFLASLPFLGIIGLIDALVVFRKDRNCLHDDIAKTRVIKLATPLQQQ